MKYFKTLKTYKASNVTFNTETNEAHSYEHWKFTAMIEGKLVFNEYKYSPSTSRHQWKVKRLLESLGIKIDLVVRFRDSLDTSDTIESITHKTDIYDTEKFISEQIKIIDRNERSRLKRLAAKNLTLVETI